MKRIVLIAAFVMAWVGWNAPARALTEAEINAGLQFNFSTPGARSLGLGGAFLGLADDATAAFTNPAGLTILSRPEISLEARGWSLTAEFTDRGHLFGEPTGIGTDTIRGLRRGDTDANTTGLSFLSYVYPGNRWALAFYRHELANFKAAFQTQGAYMTSQDPDFPISRLFPVLADMNLEIVNFGASAAFQVSPELSLGLGVSYYDFELDSTTRRFNLRVDSRLDEPGGFFGEPDFSAGNEFSIQQQIGSDSDIAFNAGLLWRPSGQWSVGLVYRQGPELDFVARSRFGGMHGPDAGRIFASKEVSFRMPDLLGAGLAFRPSDPVTLLLDVNRIRYSKLTSNVQSIFFEPDDDSPAAIEAALAVRKLRVDDGTEIRLGFEYVFLDLRNPVALRLGVWHDPDHRIRFDGSPVSSREEALAALFFRGDDEVHFSAGLGLVVGDRFQIDAAVDLSDVIDTFSLSGVLRF